MKKFKQYYQIPIQVQIWLVRNYEIQIHQKTANPQDLYPNPYTCTSLVHWHQLWCFSFVTFSVDRIAAIRKSTKRDFRWFSVSVKSWTSDRWPSISHNTRTVTQHYRDHCWASKQNYTWSTTKQPALWSNKVCGKQSCKHHKTTTSARVTWRGCCPSSFLLRNIHQTTGFEAKKLHYN